jgi:predicted site-specific integrase-resolvase
MGKVGVVMSNDSPAINQKRATPRELAEHFSTTVPTVLSWYHTGDIPAVVAIGRIYRFDIPSVEAALAARKGKGIRA